MPALDVVVCDIDFSLWPDNHLFIRLVVMFFLITHTVTACIIIDTRCIIIDAACIIIADDNFFTVSFIFSYENQFMIFSSDSRH